ncbi:MAG: type I-E CRISPR-associated protein Cas6/Cse3/CasE [Thermodesulfobacteriota bacterium]|nr:type I-E CRISPR-associated protein Cas6/Cse3/CasE [Thermodesulfobacteriota bacterium]
MYLSKCLVTGRRPMNPYQVHQKIWSLFPNRPEAKRDFLFRVEQFSPGGQAILLQSALMPVAVKGDLVLLDQKEISYSFGEGMGLRFLLTANPTKRIRDVGGKKKNQGKCRVPLIDEDEIRDWLVRKFTGVAQLHEMIIAGKNTLYFRKKGNPGKIATVTYSGLLTVSDGDFFQGFVEKGIGPAKAFGCGLLSLARV